MPNRLLGLAALLTSLPAVAAAQSVAPGPLLLEGMFQDRAIFQRDRPIPVWGNAFPGEAVTVRFAGDTVQTRADKAGTWQVRLPARPAGGPYQLSVSTARGAAQTLQDILVGDVWLCSGQSNMEMDVSRALNSHSEVASAGDDQIRLLTVGHDAGLTPVRGFKTPVRWQSASPASVADFSAVCYFMGRDLRASQKVPIGLIDASWGGTAIDAWRSEAAIEKAGNQDDRLAVLRTYRKDPVAGSRLWGSIWERWWRAGSGDAPGSEPWQDQGGSAADWKSVPRLSNWESWGIPELTNFNGAMWYRTSVTLTPQQARQQATLNVGWVDDLDQTWVNGVAVGSTYGPNSARAYTLPAGTLKPGLNSIVVNVLDTYGAGGMTGPEEMRAITFADGTSVRLGGEWSYSVAPASVGWPPRAPWETNSGLSTIYNGMIAPMGSYGLRGVAWYQGESDAGAERGYAAKLGSLMSDWRRQFQHPTLPFLVVQLAGWGPSPASPQESGSATVRDEQRLAVAADRHAGLAVAMDLGDRADIHPANKQEVGRRLARAARHVAYGEKIAPSGPEAVAAVRSGGTVSVSFKNFEGQLVSYNSSGPIGFELCGSEQGSCRFVAAEVRGSDVVIAGDTSATRIRYCWGDSPVCNLYDKAGLPAGPFELRIR